MSNTIMFIDDDEAFLLLMKKFSMESAYVSNVLTAIHGQDALDKLIERAESGQELPTLTFVDINMPVMDGFQFVDEFMEARKKHPPLVNVRPIVILTSSRDVKDMERVEQSELITSFVVKPSDYSEIVLTIEKLLGGPDPLSSAI